MNIAIVTGASSGMGREFVLQLSKYVQVDEIWAIARRADALESLKSPEHLRIKATEIKCKRHKKLLSANHVPNY